MTKQRSISNVVVMHAHSPMRMLLRMALEDDGYTVTEAPTYTTVLRHLHSSAEPVLVVAGNWGPDYRAEQEFFGRIAADAALARRHRFVLLTTLPEWLPDVLDVTLRGLGVPVLRMPSRLPELLETAAVTAGRRLAVEESVG